jgi:hypothetical protein
LEKRAFIARKLGIIMDDKRMDRHGKRILLRIQAQKMKKKNGSPSTNYY